MYWPKELGTNRVPTFEPRTNRMSTSQAAQETYNQILPTTDMEVIDWLAEGDDTGVKTTKTCAMCTVSDAYCQIPCQAYVEILTSLPSSSSFFTHTSKHPTPWATILLTERLSGSAAQLSPEHTPCTSGARLLLLAIRDCASPSPSASMTLAGRVDCSR